MNTYGEKDIHIKNNREPITNMHIGQNNAIFSTKTRILMFSGIPPRHKSVSTKDSPIIYRWLTRDDNVASKAPVLNIIDAIQELEPEIASVENTKYLASCWDHFLAK
jgi:hypothetical protein